MGLSEWQCSFSIFHWMRSRTRQVASGTEVFWKIFLAPVYPQQHYSHHEWSTLWSTIIVSLSWEIQNWTEQEQKIVITWWSFSWTSLAPDFEHFSQHETLANAIVENGSNTSQLLDLSQFPALKALRRKSIDNITASHSTCAPTFSEFEMEKVITKIYKELFTKINTISWFSAKGIMPSVEVLFRQPWIRP